MCTRLNGCCQRHPGACQDHGHGRQSLHSHIALQRHSPQPEERPFWLARGGEAQRREALGAHHLLKDDDAFPAAVTPKPACTAALVMLENRPLRNASSYWTKVIALNYLYATRHGYSFFLMAPRRSGAAAKGVYYSWCKIETLTGLVERLSAPPAACKWLVFLDSDAYIREQLVSVPQLLRTLGAPAAHAHLVIGREKALRSEADDSVRFSTAFALNTGVLFLRASNWTRDLLQAWASLEHTVCTGKYFRRQAEQKCFERLLVDQRRRMPQGATERVVHVPMQHFNSPWGRYARHIWGGEGVRLRASVYDDELKVQGVWTAAQQMALVEAARRVGSARTC